MEKKRDIVPESLNFFTSSSPMVNPHTKFNPKVKELTNDISDIVTTKELHIVIGISNGNAEKQEQEEEDSMITSNASMLKVACTQDKLKEGNMTTVNNNDKEAREEQPKEVNVFREVQEAMKKETRKHLRLGTQQQT